MNDYVVPAAVIAWAKREISLDDGAEALYNQGFEDALKTFLNKINVPYSTEEQDNG